MGVGMGMDSYGTSISNTSGTSSGASRSSYNIRALGPNKTGDEEDEDDEACKIAEMPEELKHARFKVRGQSSRERYPCTVYAEGDAHS